MASQLSLEEIRKERERLRKRKNGIIKKAEQFRRVSDVDVAVLIHDRSAGEYHSYRSNKSFAPAIEEIVSRSLLYRSRLTRRRVKPAQQRISSQRTLQQTMTAMYERAQGRRSPTYASRQARRKRRRGKGNECTPDVMTLFRGENPSLCETQHLPQSCHRLQSFLRSLGSLQFFINKTCRQVSQAWSRLGRRQSHLSRLAIGSGGCHHHPLARDKIQKS